jgi:phage terminase large subunit-like protein
MTLAVAHGQEKKVVLDALLEFIPPFDPGLVIQEIVEVSRHYRIRKIIQDRHAVAWIANDFKPHGIEVEISDKTKSQIYEHFAVAMNKNLVELLDNKRLKDQVINLQKYLRPGGMVKIDHVSGAHDDVINAVAGAVVLAVLAEDEKPIAMSIYREAARPLEPEYSDSGEPMSEKEIRNFLYDEDERAADHEENVRLGLVRDDKEDDEDF